MSPLKIRLFDKATSRLGYRAGFRIATCLRTQQIKITLQLAGMMSVLITEKTRFYVWNLGLPLAIALAIFLVFDITALDVRISDWLYYPQHVFPFAHDRLFENLTHRWPRIIPNWTGEAAVIGTILSFIWPLLKPGRNDRLLGMAESMRIAPILRFTARHRRDFLFIVVAFAVTTGMIHFFKSHTSIYCPVETTLYGGTMQKKEWFENFTLLSEAGAGRCWPGGHASGGFTMLALYFVARRYRWRFAKAVLYASLILGAIYGTTRVVQGWHFMSHTFWAGVIVWLSALFTALVFYGWQQLAQPVLAAQCDVGKRQDRISPEVV